MFDRALIIKKRWLDMILDGKKTWEIRGSDTKIRGRIGLIESGSGLIVGECELIDSKRFTKEMKTSGFENHRLDLYDLSMIDYKNPWAWIMEKHLRYKNPVPYNHPQGAVIWVKIRDFSL